MAPTKKIHQKKQNAKGNRTEKGQMPWNYSSYLNEYYESSWGKMYVLTIFYNFRLLCEEKFLWIVNFFLKIDNFKAPFSAKLNVR